MKYAVIIYLLLLFGCGGNEPRQLSVELNGDSILHGHELVVKPAARLAQIRPNLVVYDRTESGLTLNSLFTGYEKAWINGPIPRLGIQAPFNEIKRTSNIVVISLGGNDAYGNLSIIEFERQLRDIINLIRQEGRIPLVTGIVQLTATDIGFDQDTVDRSIEFNRVIEKVTLELNVLNANWDTVEYNGLIDTIDGIHRTQEASDRLVVRLAETLDQIK